LIFVSNISCKNTGPQQTPNCHTRNPLGCLSGLTGTWMGTGMVVISLPDFDSNPPSTGPSSFRLLVNNTKELLTFTPIGGNVPNRGSILSFETVDDGQPDINIFGLTYLQHVSDALSNKPMHVETGMWINVPPTEYPPQGQTVVRMGTIPHGDAFLAQSNLLLVAPEGPKIAVASITPFPVDTSASLHAGYFDLEDLLPPGFDYDVVNNPNLLLEDAIADQNIVNTVVLSVSTSTVGGILNIPFVVSNANVTSFDAIFWIETVLNEDGSTFQQLQYTQTIILEFLGIFWPHITVSTLVLQ